MDTGSNGQARPPGGVARPTDEEGDGYLVTDRMGLILEANDAAAALLGTRSEFLKDKPFPLFLSDGHRTALYALLSQTLHQPGTIQEWRVRFRNRRGEPAVALTMCPVIQADHSVRLRWLLRDISRNLQAERALEAERAYADTLLDAAQALALILDGKGHILRCNPFARVASGLEDRDLLDREWASALLDPASRQTAREAVHRAAYLGGAVDFTASLLNRDGHGRAVAWSVKAIQKPETRGPYVLALGHDITELQQAQQRALDAERLAAIGQVTTAMAHESRNLLQSISSCLERLAWRLEGQEGLLDLVRRAQKAQRGLTLLFDDVRQYASPVQLNLAPCALPELWREVWAEVRERFPEREADLCEEFVAPPECQVDRFRLGQVFRNVMENSFAACGGARGGPGGPVRMEVRCTEAILNSHPAVRLSLRDNGPGLGPEQRKRLFEPFFTTRPEGTGLGMTIAKRIVEAHGGRIDVGDAAPGLEIILVLPRNPT